MVIVLKNQVEASERSSHELAAQLDSDRIADARANLTHEIRSHLKEVISIAGDLFDQAVLCQHLAADAAAIERGRETYRLFVRVEALFSRCHGMLQKLVRIVDPAEIREQDQFYRTWQKVGDVTAFDYDRTIQAHEQLQRGEGRDLDEVMNELQHQA